MKSDQQKFAPVPSEVVTEIWQEMGAMSVDAIPGLMEKIQSEQPALLAYLLAVSEANFKTQEAELVVYLGTVVWQMMRRWHRQLMRVSVKKLDQAEEENLAELESMSQVTEVSMWTHSQFILETYPEPEILRYLVEALTESEDVKLSDEDIGLAFLYLKTALDALIRCRVF
ncbi:MAG: hypothetical protein ISS57_05765 [Anaerolineales bacterium]|nr:hypothetical protein [Chloroflexota bacterium]MBL7162092.1 hypothetical protein [Anaerolineales bacterium]